MDEEINRLRELVRLQDEYIALLAKSEASSAGLLYAHGWHTPDEMVQRGKELREAIAALRGNEHG